VRPGCAVDRSPPSSAAVMEELSYTSTHPLGHTGPAMGTIYLYLFYIYRRSDKFLARPGRKQANVSVEWPEFPSAPCLGRGGGTC